MSDSPFLKFKTAKTTVTFFLKGSEKKKFSQKGASVENKFFSGSLSDKNIYFRLRVF